MEMYEGTHIGGFYLEEKKWIEEIGGEGYYFIHQNSKVKVLALCNKDPHKTFSINFKTLPTNHKGIAHVVEHAVCCASKNYPLKETFMALGQGSICTTMNACTYPDRTMYYASSPSEKDLLGVFGVYMDLVFQPAFLTSSQYFYQEGWHYELESPQAPLEISGVVYQEMLGEYGEAGAYLQLYELETLFPDNCYQYDAGGIPEEISTLTERECIDFYQQHYVGANTTLVLYGDIVLSKWLECLEETYLKNVRVGNPIMGPTKQDVFTKPRYTLAYYPSTLSYASTLMSLGFVVGDSMDCEQRLGFELLEHILLRSTASPLTKKIVIEEKLGKALGDGGYDSCRLQPTFSITLKGSSPDKASLFEELVLEELSRLVAEGIEPELIDAAISTLAFDLLEIEGGEEPAGIIYSEFIINSLYSGGQPFSQLKYQEAFSKIKKNCHQGYFESIIQKYFLENNHRSLTVVVPSASLQEEKRCQEEERLSKIQAQLSMQEKKDLIELNKVLEKAQLEENSEVLLETLPHLTLEDLPIKLPELKIDQKDFMGGLLQLHEDETKGISYCHLIWDASCIPYEQLPVLGLLTHIFTYIGTKSLSFSQLENQINQYTGAMHVSLHACKDEQKDKVYPAFKLSCKVMRTCLPQFESLMKTLLTETQFTEKEKLYELIGATIYEIENSFSGAPEYRSTQRVYAYLSPEGFYEDAIEGIGFYKYIKEVYKEFDARYLTLVQELESVSALLFCQTDFKISVTTSKEDQSSIEKALENIIGVLPHRVQCTYYSVQDWFNQYRILSNEGFVNGQDVQALTMGMDYKAIGYAYKGQLEVVANVLENTYLWDRIRLKGGAYGCEMTFTREGYVSICSYCDPKIKATLETFKQISSYLKHLELSQHTIERAVISTLSPLLAPSSMEQKSNRVCQYLLCGTSQKERQEIYEQILSTTLKDFHEAAKLFEAFDAKGRLCIFGNKQKIKRSRMSLTLIDLME